MVYFFSLFFSFIATLSAFADTDSLRARIRDIACAEILKVEDIQFREFNDAPGFFMLDSAVPKGLTSVVELRKLTMSKNFSGFTLHELDSAAAYARIVFRSRGERVVFIPSLHERPVPGFDGVIVNSYGLPIANFSLKTLLKTNVKQKHKSFYLRRAFLRVIELSEYDAWMNESLKLSGAQHGLKKNRGLKKVLERSSRFMTSAMHLFGVTPSGPQRRGRIVYDLRLGQAPIHSGTIESLRRNVSKVSEKIEGIHLLTNSELVLIEP